MVVCVICVRFLKIGWSSNSQLLSHLSLRLFVPCTVEVIYTVVMHEGVSEQFQLFGVRNTRSNIKRVIARLHHCLTVYLMSPLH